MLGLAGLGALAYLRNTDSGQLFASRFSTLLLFHGDITTGLTNLRAEANQFSAFNAISGTYPQASLSAVLQQYATAFPNVTNRACKTAEEQYEASLKGSISSQGRQGITFVPGALVMNANLALDDSTDNVLILVPNGDVGDLSRLGDSSWYDTAAKKNILFFYPGVSPTVHIGNLYDALTAPGANFYKPLRVQAFGAQKF